MVENRLLYRKRDKQKPLLHRDPPSSVTGVLTMGHVLNNTIQDILVSEPDNWVIRSFGFREPIMRESTQTKVEQALRGRSRKNWDATTFSSMLLCGETSMEESSFGNCKMGCSCDWDRRSHLGRRLFQGRHQAFVKLFKKG